MRRYRSPIALRRWLKLVRSGPAWITPDKPLASAVGHLPLQHLVAGPVEVLPAVALFDDGLQVFEPDDAVLHRVFDDGAGDAGSQVARVQHAVAVIGGHGEAAGDDGDRLGGRERAARRL